MYKRLPRTSCYVRTLVVILASVLDSRPHGCCRDRLLGGGLLGGGHLEHGAPGASHVQALSGSEQVLIVVVHALNSTYCISRGDQAGSLALYFLMGRSDFSGPAGAWS